MKRALMLAAIAGAVASASAAFASESVMFSAQPSDDHANGTSVSAMLTGGYTLGSIDWAGMASTVNSATWGSELHVDISSPFGSGTITLGSGTTYSPSASFSGSSNVFSNAGDPSGMWTFDFYDSYLDSGAGGTDANWDSITFTFNDYVPPTAPASTDLGVISSPTSTSGDIAASTVDWYQFVYQASGDGTFEINTEGSSGIGDSELGLYDSAGNLVANNDDASGLGLLSRLSFAAGDLTDGATYYVAVGGYNTTYNSSGWDASSASTHTGQYNLNFIPTPGSLALMGLGGLAAVRRRRR